jgi:polycomb protein EED
VLIVSCQSITSIAVHPRWPHIFCTTSRDFSTRIYNLGMAPRSKPLNTHWPPSLHPSFAGPAHGLDMVELEGAGTMARCTVVLMGGRSGGHRGDVLSAV